MSCVLSVEVAWCFGRLTPRRLLAPLLIVGYLVLDSYQERIANLGLVCEQMYEVGICVAAEADLARAQLNLYLAYLIYF